MVLTEQDIKTYFRVLVLLNENLAGYEDWMNRVEADPVQAGEEFLVRLRAARRSVKVNRLITQLIGILADDYDFFQYPATNQKQAVQFLISNALLSAAKLGLGESVDVIQQIAEQSSDTVL